MARASQGGLIQSVGAPNGKSHFVLTRWALIDANMGIDGLSNWNGVKSLHPLSAATVRDILAARLPPMLNQHATGSPLGGTITPAASCYKEKIKIGRGGQRRNALFVYRGLK